MSFALPESMREYIDNRVAAGQLRQHQRVHSRPGPARPGGAGQETVSGPHRGRPGIRARPASHQGRREGTAGDRSRRDRLKPAVLRPQALRDQQGEVRYYRKAGGARVAVGVAKASNAALDRVELDPCIGSPTLGKFLGIPGFGLGGSQSSRCSGATSNAETTLMWSGCWASAKTSPRSWATSLPRTDGTRVGGRRAGGQ